MENMNDSHKHLDALHCRIQAQGDALEDLQKTFTEQAEQLLRHDQAQCLDDLREKVEHEIAYIEYGETVASVAFKNSKIETGLFNFAAGTLAGLLFRLKEQPLKMGARLALNEFAYTKPFGTFMVGIGANGVPDDVHVFPVSEYARKRCISESTVKAELEARGYRLYTPVTFFAFLGRLKDGLLQGTSSLPATGASTAIKLVRLRS
jgi:hypothetical protein